MSFADMQPPTVPGPAAGPPAEIRPKVISTTKVRPASPGQTCSTNAGRIWPDKSMARRGARITLPGLAGTRTDGRTA